MNPRIDHTMGLKDGFTQWWESRKDAVVNADSKLRHVKDEERLRIVARMTWLAAKASK